jgi:hypothetical protein
MRDTTVGRIVFENGNEHFLPSKAKPFPRKPPALATEEELVASGALKINRKTKAS